MDNTIFYILGGLLLVYFLIATFNKKKGRKRKSRNFMEGQRLRDRYNDDRNSDLPRKE
ncbi:MULTISPECIES: hypothetical protein [Robiginitalea]|uniref:Uncharacterized protein n=1 Tax=Robiginitalea biformata (strain ATCC BAA-864 / DSM 15991 / KCTC 12146 / HTCC2501) TaxID=313596 RepID=A4CMU3_ROBBH|nr:MULTISPECIES: hypothetical protein [Robiginitalea]EAR14985.1 hypothetical protein RB2501_11682 [Robiginitalea biformata HTCC2501]MDC6355198.1 hypothetical protein [Robiginitalea sp. PM2]MDC6375587.1 hypothetical protein [Robiginitalea sp. SP8]